MPIYTPAETANQLNIQPTTLRKYSQLLEKFGYSFLKTAQQQRSYTDKDVEVLKKLVSLKRVGGMSLEDAAKGAYFWSKEDNMSDPFAATESDTGRHMATHPSAVAQLTWQAEAIEQLLNNQEETQRLLKDLLARVDEEREGRASTKPVEPPKYKLIASRNQPSNPVVKESTSIQPKNWLQRLFRR